MISYAAFVVAVAIGAPHVVDRVAENVPTAPTIQCEVTMSQWCIAIFDGTIELKDTPSARIWSLQERLTMRDGPLTIIEDKKCIGDSDAAPHFVNQSKVTLPGGRIVNSVKFNINSNNCSLEFRWPVGKEDDPEYKQTMLYGVLIGTENSKIRQLYKLVK